MKCPFCGIEVTKIEQNGYARFMEVTLKKTPPHYKILSNHYCKRVLPKRKR
jgi:hypothetical protein